MSSSNFLIDTAYKLQNLVSISIRRLYHQNLILKVMEIKIDDPT